MLGLLSPECLVLQKKTTEEVFARNFVPVVEGQLEGNHICGGWGTLIQELTVAERTKPPYMAESDRQRGFVSRALSKGETILSCAPKPGIRVKAYIEKGKKAALFLEDGQATILQVGQTWTKETGRNALCGSLVDCVNKHGLIDGFLLNFGRGVERAK